ncbi:hypothetical protein WA026_000051 [Henosepilachna vigintioctopunctata]|uniref:Uncharacterized protein n=1 Tax=Henosepilachna vigintioctopunctata TaxID=420089 RepID=A0AAW1V6N7_9CUCU
MASSAGGHASGRDKIFRIQRRMLRIVAGLYYRSCCRGVYGELGIMSFPELYIYECLLYARSNVHCVTRNSDFHSYKERGGSDVRSSSFRPFWVYHKALI